MLIDTIGSCLWITQYILRMILIHIYNFMSATMQIISFLPLCCVFLVTSKNNCFGLSSTICLRSNYSPLYSIIFLSFLVWILFFGDLETGLQYLGYSKTNKTTNITNDMSTDLNINFKIGNNANDTNNSNTDKGSHPTEQTLLRGNRLVGSKANAPKMAYFHALPPKIVKLDTVFQDNNKKLQKYKRKASKPLAAVSALLDIVNPLHFNYNPVILQSTRDISQLPKKKSDSYT